MLERSFARNVLTVLTGAAMAQALPLLVSPLLTRLYTPGEFGALASYNAVVAISIVVATGRYELAVLLPRQRREAFDLCVLSLAVAVGLAGLTMIGLLLWRAIAGELPVVAAGWGAWAYALPASIVLAAAFQVLMAWQTRAAEFKSIAAARVGQAGLMSGMQVVVGLNGAGVGGLVAGPLVGFAAGCAMLWHRAASEWRHQVRKPSLLRLRAVARKHRRFPLFMIPGQLANATSTQVPVLLLGAGFDASVAGFYSLAERVLILPSYLIGNAVGDVYRQRAAEHYHREGNCRTLFLTSLRLLALLGLVPAAIVALAAPFLFSWVFGSSWREAGELAVLLAPMMYCQILGSPLSQTVYLAHMQSLDMLWQFGRLGLAVGAVLVGQHIGGGHRTAVALFSAVFCLMYLLHLCMQYRAACGVGHPSRHQDKGPP